MKQKHIPYSYRIYVEKKTIEPIFVGNAPFGIAFGGQMSEIQRIVFGTDTENRMRIARRVSELFDNYRDLLHNYLKGKKITEVLPKSNAFAELSFFNNWDLTDFNADWGNFSNQNAIECVSWFVGIMIKSHEFSSHLPTVGGKIHIGLITKDKGFSFISEEEYIHEGRRKPMEDL